MKIQTVLIICHDLKNNHMPFTVLHHYSSYFMKTYIKKTSSLAKGNRTLYYLNWAIYPGPNSEIHEPKWSWGGGANFYLIMFCPKFAQNYRKWVGFITKHPSSPQAFNKYNTVNHSSSARGCLASWYFLTWGHPIYMV